jgi:ectoine hydroxylase
MQLSGVQLSEVTERGFVLLPGMFSPREMDLVRGSVPRVIDAGGPEVIREDSDPTVVKMIFATHRTDDVFGRVARHPRVIGPVEQVLGDRAHLFQSRLNIKAAFRGEGWPWHQDFNQWHRLDGMQTPRAVIAALFLDDVNPCNGPLRVIPGSQKLGHVVNDVSMETDEAVVEAAANESGIVPLMGPAGTVALFDCLIIHGSAHNITPWPRRILYLNFSAASNRDFVPRRATFHCDTDVRPILPLADDCLTERKATA